MDETKRKVMLAAAASGGLYAALGAGAVCAESWPSRPIKVVIGQTAGGAPDILMRLVGQRLAQLLGQPLVVELKPSAGGVIAADAVAKSPPDGYTWLLATPTALAVAPFLRKKLPYDAERDFAPVSLMGQTDNVLVLGPRLKNVNNVAQLIAHAKAHPASVSYASAGLGTASHLAGELLAGMAQVELLHVPYKGAGQALNDVVGGQADFIITSPLSARAHIDSARVRAIAVTGAQRDPHLPKVPLLSATVPGYHITQWWGIVLRSGTPAAVVEKVHAAFTQVINEPQMKARFAEQGVTPRSSTPDEFRAFLTTERTRYQSIIQRAGIPLED